MDRVKWFGFFISAAMGKKAGEPEKAKMIVATPCIACAKLGLPTSLKSGTNGPVCGAAEGRSCTPTAMVTVNIETRMLTIPTAASQLILDRVRMDENPKAATAATATRTAVHAPWDERAFRPIEMLNILEPATKM